MKTNWTSSVMIAVGLLCGGRGLAADGEWAVNADGDWSDTANWKDGVVAEGVGATADFSKVNISPNSVNRKISLDQSGVVVGHLKFADAGASDGYNTGSHTLAGEGMVLELSTGGVDAPSIATGAGSYNAGNSLFIEAILSSDEEVKIIPLPDPFKYRRPVILLSANELSRKVTVEQGAWVEMRDENALGTATVELKDESILYARSFQGVGTTITNAITIGGGSKLAGVGVDNKVGTIFSGPIGIKGHGVFVGHGDGYNGQNHRLVVSGVISDAEPGASAFFSSEPNGGYRGSVVLTEANTYTGTTVVYRTNITLEDADGFGSAVSDVVVDGISGREGRVILTAPDGINPAKTLYLQQYGGLEQRGGTIVTSDIVVEGGRLTWGKSPVSSALTNASEIVIAAGTTLTIDKTSTDSIKNAKLYQTGRISGAGNVVLTGYNGWDGSIYLYGDNSYSGGTILLRSSNSLSHYQYIHSDTAFGTGPISLEPATGSGTTMMTLGRDITFANELQGLGKIDTQSFTLTTTGSIEPRGIPSGEFAAPSTLSVNRLAFGTDVDGCDYVFRYDAEASSLVAATTALTIGAAPKVVTALWVDAEEETPAIGDYPLFSYTGDDPAFDASEWTVVAPKGLRGKVWLDDAAKQVMLIMDVAPPPQTVIILR